MQIIYDGRKVQVWEFVSQGLNIGKWSTGKHCDGVAVVKNVKTMMCQEGGTIPLRYIIFQNHILITFCIPQKMFIKGRRSGPFTVRWRKMNDMICVIC